MNYDLISKLIVKTGYAINLMIFVFAIWLSYKHFYHNAGKGIDDFLLALCLITLSSFFVVSSMLSANQRQVRLSWLWAGFIFIFASGMFTYLKLDAYIAVIAVLQLSNMLFIILSVNSPRK